ncbi:hypothetical protein METHB2_50002 [Candidatus Methylobacter favarea]|uniref:Uncharacterized protein n=1 Tax=Candidatus Methylobacter favarea TaxID=2707345 RepID=A0A8S0XHC6_9GAMM|nr:hypothetical protein METHB2_50002 [Candidatus Methylobacter favarea]
MSLRGAPLVHPNVKFYSRHAGEHDQIHSGTLRGIADCR